MGELLTRPLRVGQMKATACPHYRQRWNQAARCTLGHLCLVGEGYLCEALEEWSVSEEEDYDEEELTFRKPSES